MSSHTHCYVCAGTLKDLLFRFHGSVPLCFFCSWVVRKLPVIHLNCQAPRTEEP
jgi:hypothetical protein